MEYPIYHDKLFYPNQMDSQNGTNTDILRRSILQLPGHTGTQPREALPPPVPGKGFIGFTENFMMGNTFADTYQNSKEFNVPVMMENRESFGKLYKAYKPDITDEKIINSDFAAFQNMYTNNYLKGIFDPYDFNGTYDFDESPQTGFRAGMQRWHPLDKRFDLTVNPIMQDIPGMAHGEKLPFQEAQDYALESGFYIDKKGREVPNFLYDQQKHNPREIRWKQDSLTNENYPYFVELQDGAIVTKSMVEPANFWGPKKLHSSIVGSIIRGAHSGLVVKTAKAGEAIIGMIYDLTQINEPYNGNLEAYYGKSWLGRTYIDLQNWTNINAKQNYDETQGFFDDWNAALYSVFDVAGQAAMVYLTAGAGGAIAGATGTSKALAQTLAVQASLGVGALTSTGMRREELLDKGYDISTANKLAGFYGMQTLISENIFRTNLIAKQGFIAGRKASTSTIRKQTQTAFKNTIEKTKHAGMVGKLKLAPETQMKRGKGLLGATWGRVATIFGNVSEKTVTGKGAKAWFVAKRSLAAGTEETLEEMFENVTNIGTGVAVNNYWVEHAYSVRRRYGISKYQKRTNPINGKTEYTELIHGLPMTTIGEDDYNSVQRSLTHAQDIISGKSQMDTSWHSDEFWAAFIGSALMGGAGSIFTYNNGKDNDIQLHAIGYHLYQNPSDRQNILGAAKDMVSTGEIAQEEADRSMIHFEQSLDFFVDYYTRVEKEQPGLLFASGHDKSILYDFYRLDHKKGMLNLAKKGLAEGKPLTEAEGFSEEFPEIIAATKELTDEKITESVDEHIAKIEKEMALYQPKQGASYSFDGTDVEAGRSLIYDKNFTDVMGYKKQVNHLADLRAKQRSTGIRTEVKKFFLGEKAERQAYDKAFAEEKKLILNSGDLLHYINLQNQLTGKNEFVFELSEKYDYFRDNVHKPGFELFIKMHNNEITNSLKYYDEQRVNDVIQDTEAFLDTEIKYKDFEGKEITKKVREFLTDLQTTDNIEGKLNGISTVNEKNDMLEGVLNQIGNIQNDLSKLSAASKVVKMTPSQTEAVKRNSSEISKLYQGVRDKLAKSAGDIASRRATRAQKSTQATENELISEGIVNKRFRQSKALGLDTIDIDAATTGEIKSVTTMQELLAQNPTALQDYSIWAAYMPVIAKMSDEFKMKAIALVEGLLANSYTNKETNQKRIVSQAFENLDAEISQQGTFSNPKALQADIDFMVEMLDYIDHYIDMNRSLFQEDFEKDQKYAEHSRLQEYFKGEGEIAQKFSNEMTRLNAEEAAQAGQLVKMIRKQLLEYGEDERFTESNREAGNVKVWIARVARQVDMINNIITKNLIKNDDVMNEISKKVSIIDTIMEKYKDENLSETDESSVWKLDGKFRTASEQDQLNIQRDLATINQAVMDVRDIISKNDEATKDIDAYIVSIADAYKEKTKNASGIYAANPYGKEALYNKSASGYSKLVSPKTYEQGRDMLFSDEKKTTRDERNSMDYFVNTSYIFFKGIVAENSGEFTSKDATTALEEILFAENESDNKMSPVETWEQINTLVDALIFVGDTDNRMGFEGSKYKGIFETTIRRALSVSGYGGTGKTEVFTGRLLQLITKITGEPLQITIVTPNNDVASKHKERIDAINNSGTGTINVHYVKAWEIVKEKGKDFDIVFEDQNKENKTQMIFVEEYSLYDVNEANIFKDHATKQRNIPFIFIGDTAQTPNITSNTPLNPPIETMTLAIEPLTEPFRTGYVNVYMVSELYRMNFFQVAANGIAKFEDHPGKWKYEGERNESNKHGAQYYPDTSDGKKAIEEAFLVAAKELGTDATTKNILLIVSSYEDFERLSKDTRYQPYLDNIRTLQGDATIESTNIKFQNKNVSGLDSERVYSTTRISDTGNLLNYYAMMVTSSSRAKTYLALIGNINSNDELSTEDVMAKYTGLSRTQEQQVEYRKDVADLLHIINTGEVVEKKKIGGGAPVIYGTKGTSYIYDNRTTIDNASSISKNIATLAQTLQGMTYSKSSDIDYAHVTDQVYGKDISPEKRAMVAKLATVTASMRYVALPTKENETSLYKALEQYQKYVTISDPDAYIETVIKSAEGIYGTLNLDPELTFIGKSIGYSGNGAKKGIMGTPLATTLVGYKNTDNGLVPIVDIIGIAPIGTGAIEAVNITPQRLLQYAYYINILGKKGVLVNDVAFAVVNTTAIPYFKETIRFSSDEMAIYVDQARQENDNFKTDDPTPFATTDELYSIPRVEEDLSSVPYEYGQYIRMDNNQTYAVNGVIYLPGEEEPYLEMFRMDTTEVLMKLSEVQSHIIHVTHNPADGLFMDSANRFVDASQVYSNIIAIPMFTGTTQDAAKNNELIAYFNSIDNFYQHIDMLNSDGTVKKGNMWLAAKRFISLQSGNMSSTVTKIYYRKGEFYDVDQRGWVEYQDVFINKLTKGAMETMFVAHQSDFISYGYESVDELIDDRLDYLSFDGQVDYQFDTKGESTFLIDNPNYEKYFLQGNNGMSDVEMKAFLLASFQASIPELPQQQGDTLFNVDNLVQFNMYKLRLIREARELPDVEASAVTLTAPTAISGPVVKIPLSNRNSPVDLRLAKASIEKDGYLIDLDVWTDDVKPFSGKKRILIEVKDGYSKTAGWIAVYPKELDDDAEIELMFSQMNDEITKVRSDISKKDITITELKTITGKKNRRATIYNIINSLSAKQFIEHNKGAIARIPELKGIADIAFEEKRTKQEGGETGRRQINLFGKTGMTKLNSLQLTLNELHKQWKQTKGNQRENRIRLWKTMFRHSVDKNKNVLIEENLYTYTDKVFSPRPYMTPIDVQAMKSSTNTTGRRATRDVGELESGWNDTPMATGVNFDVEDTDTDTAIAELSQIIGANIMYDKYRNPVRFEDGAIKTLNGENARGLVREGLIMLGRIGNGKIKGKVHYHEAIHFILEYMTSPTEARNIVQNAREYLAKKKGKDISQVSFRQAHEYLAEMYEVHRYLKVPKKGIINKFINFVKRVIFRLGSINGGVSSFFQNVDSGYYVGRDVSSQGNLGLEFASVSNPYTKEEGHELMAKYFKNTETVDFVLNYIVAPGIKELSRYGKGVLTAPSTNPTMYDNHNYDKNWLQAINEYHQNASLRFEKNDKIGKHALKNIRIDSLTADDIESLTLDLKLNQQGRLSDEKKKNLHLLGLYAMRSFYQEPELYYTVVQKMFTGIDLYKAVHDNPDEFNNWMQGNHYDSDYQENPSKEVNNFLKTIFETTQLYSYTKREPIAFSTMSWPMLEELVYQAKESILNRTEQFNINTLVGEFVQMLDMVTSPNRRNHLYTFIIEYGQLNPLAYGNQLNLKPDAEGMVDITRRDYFSKAEIVMAKGYAYLSQRDNVLNDPDLSPDDFSNVRNAIIDRRRGYEDIISKLESHFLSYTDNAIIGENTLASPQLTKLTHNAGKISKANLRENTQRRHYELDDATAKDETIRMLTGKEKRYKITTEGIEILKSVDDKKGWEKVFSGPVPNQIKNVQAILQEIFNYSFSEQVVKDAFFKKVYINNRKTDFIGVQRAQGFRYDTRKHLEMLMGTLYVSAVQTQLANRKKTKVKSEMSNAKRVMDELKQFYTDNGYLRHGSEEQINQEAATLDGESYLYPPQPRNMWKFFEDVLAYNIEFNEDIKTKKMTNMQGKIVATLTLVTTMLQTGRAMDFRNLGDMPYVKRLKNQMTEDSRRGMIYTKPGQQPLYEFDEQGNPTYNNALLNGTMKYDKIYEYINKTGEFSTVDVNKLTKYDIYRTLYEWTRDNFIRKDGINHMPVLLDIYSDRSKLWFTEWFSKDAGIFYKRELKGKGKNRYITQVFPQYQRFESMLNDTYNYGKQRRAITLNKWNQVTELKYNQVITKDDTAMLTKVFVKLQENIDYRFDENGNIGIGNGFHQPSNALLKVPQKTWDSLDAQGKYDIVLKIHESDINDLRSISDSSGFTISEESVPFRYPKKLDQNNLEIRLDAIEQIADESFAGIPEIESAYKALVSSMAELRTKDLTLYDAMEVRQMMMDVTSGIYLINQVLSSLEMEINLKPLSEAAYSLRDAVIDNSVLIEKQSRAISEVMFMSHYLFNNAYSSLNRGPYEMFSNLTDYFKRGLGFTAPGEVYNTKLYEGSQMAGLVLKDQKTTNKLFGDDFNSSVKISDGGNLINPISHRVIARLSGGKLSNIGKGAVKNVTYYFNPVTGRLIYDKSAQMPINESKLTDNFYRSALYAMLPPGLRKGNIEKITVNGETRWSGSLVTLKGEKWDNRIDEIVDQILLNPAMMREVITKPDGSTYTHRMADIIIHHSSMKAGASNIGTYETGWQTPEGENIISGMKLYENSVEKFGLVPIPLEFIKLQNNASKNVFESTKTIPTQLLSVIGAGSAANNARGQAINKELAKIINVKAKEYGKHINSPADAKKFLRDLTSGIYMQDRESKKIIELVENSEINPLTYRNKALGEMIKDVSTALRPTLPGVNMVQMPGLETVFEYNGRVYTNTDQSLFKGIQKGHMKARKLAPMKYFYSDGENLVPYENKRDLILDSQAARQEALEENPDPKIVNKIHIRPTEIISPFIYANRFGITKGKSLNKLMTIRTANDVSVHGNKVKNFNYRTSIDKLKHNNIKNNLEGVEKGRGATPGVASMLVGLRMEEISDYVDIDVYNYTLNEATKFATANNRQVDVDDIIDSIAGYFTRLNYALDTFNVRIPTTNASSGFVGRIIEFVWDYDNTVFISPDKNILDGSDFDIDELHQYIRPMIFSDSKKKLVTSQNKFFDNIWDYYFDGGNAEYMTENVSPDELVRYYEQNRPKDLAEAKRYQAVLGLVLEERKRQMAGKELVGHFANLETAYLKLVTIGLNQREKIFDNASLVGLNTNNYFSDIVRNISILINGATDNSKLGGVLGKLNISQQSSALVSGMLFSGITSDNLYEKLNTPLVKDIIDKMYKSQTIRKNNWRKGSLPMYIGERLTSTTNKVSKANNTMEKAQAKLVALSIEEQQEENNDKKKSLSVQILAQKKKIDTLIDKGETDIEDSAELAQLYRFATLGEQVRRLSDIISIPSRLRGHMFSIESNIRNIENALGTDIKNIISIISEFNLEEGLPRVQQIPTVERQALFSMKQNTNYKQGTDRGNLYLKTEISSRDMFNMWEVIEELPQLTAYINMLNAMKQVADTGFEIYGRVDEDNSVKQNLQNKGFFSERDQNNYDHIKTDMLIGKYLNDYLPIELVEQQWQDVQENGNTISKLTDVTYRYSMQSAYERTLFARDFYEHVQYLKEKHPNNSFLNNLNNKVVYNKQTGKPDFVMMQLKDSYYIDSSLLNFLIQHFNQLPSEERDNFRIYNMLMYGFDNRSGSLNEVIGIDMELDFSNWLQGTPRQKYFGFKQHQYLSEVYTRMPRVLPNSRRKNMSYYSKYEKGYGSLVLRQSKGDYRNDVPQTLPFSPMINTLNVGKNNPTVFPYKYGAAIDDEQIQDLREKGTLEISYVKPHGQWKQSEKGVPVKVIMPDGNTAYRKVNNDYDMSFTTKSNRFTQASTVKRKQRNQLTGASAQEVVSFLKTRINKAFPNIEIIEVYPPEDSTETRLGWTEQGKIFLNTSLIQPNTPFHELSHIYMGIIKESNPQMYHHLLDLAKQMLNSGHPTATGAIINMAKDATMEDKYDEIIAQILGWTSEDMVIADYYRFEGGEYVEKGTSFYNKVKNAINNAVKTATRMIANIMGIKISPQKTSFKTLTDFSSYFVRQVMAGNVISTISSYELSKMKHMLKVKNSEVPRNSIASLDELNKTLGVTYGNLSKEEMIIQMSDWADYISRNANTIPQRFFGSQIKFTQDELKDFSEQGKLWKTVERILQRSDVFPQRFKAFLQEGDFIGRAAKEKLFDMAGSRTKISNTNISEILQIIGYKEGYQVMSLQEAATQFGIDLNNNFEGFNPLVQVETENNQEIIISLYDVTSDPLGTPLKGYDIGTLFKNLGISQGLAKALGVTLTNTRSDIGKLNLALTANYLMASDTRIKIRQSGVLGVRIGSNKYDGLNMGDMNMQIKAIGRRVEVQEILQKGVGVTLSSIFSGNDIHYRSMDWLSYMFQYWAENTTLAKGYTETNFTTLDTNDKIRMINDRINVLLEKSETGNLDYVGKNEIIYLNNARTQLATPKMLDNQVNYHAKMSSFEKALFDTASLTDPYAQRIKHAVEISARRVVRKISQLKKDLRPVFKEYTSRAVGLIGDPAATQYGILFDTVKDIDGNQRFTGLIHHTSRIKDGMTQVEVEHTERTRQKLQDGLITEEDLKKGAIIVKAVEEAYIEFFRHKMEKSQWGAIDRKTKKPYTSEELLKRLKEETSYVSGMIPVLSKTANERLARGNLSKWISKKVVQVSDVYSFFEEDTGAQFVEEQKYITDLGDGYFIQLGWGNDKGRKDFGSGKRMNKLLGLAQERNANGNKIYKTSSADVNNNISMDLQHIMNYFLMSTYRIIEYENYALPAINATKFQLETEKDLLKVNNKVTLSFIDEFTQQAVLGKTDELDFNILGLPVDKTLQGITAGYIRPLVMAFNPSVAIISSTANFLRAQIEALSHKMSGSWQYKTADLVKASGLFFSDFDKVTQLGVHYGAVSMSEYDLLNLRIRQVGRRNLFDSFISNFTNFSTDFYARSVIMTAQMIADGSYKAHKINSDGEIEYNPNEDNQYKDRHLATENGRKQKVLYENMKQQLITDGVMTDKDTRLLRAYDDEAAKNFKFQGDKIVGAFDAVTKNMLNNHALGRVAMVFFNWTSAVISGTFGKGGFTESGGRWVAKDDNGNYVAKWEKQFVGGWLEGLGRYTNQLLRTGKTPWKDMTSGEKQVINRAIINIAGWAFIVGSYALFRKQCANGECAINPDWRVSKAAYNALDNLFIVPALWEWGNSPFAVFSIIRNGFVTAYGEWNVDPLYFIPGLRLYKYTNEIYSDIAGEDLATDIYEEIIE